MSSLIGHAAPPDHEMVEVEDDLTRIISLPRRPPLDCRYDRVTKRFTPKAEALIRVGRPDEAIAQCHAKAALVDRQALHAAQEANDTMMAFQALRRAYTIDVSPILAMVRMEAGGAIDVLEAYRASQWRSRKAQERKAVGLGAGIV